jgi:hypothetical protein
MGLTAAGRGGKGSPIRVPVCLFAMLVAIFAAVGGAAASSDARRVYAARVEPICKASAPAIEHLLSGTRRMATHGEPVAAGRRFVRASNVFAVTVRKVGRVHRPASESARLGKWIDRLRNVKEGLRRVGTALKRRDRLEALNRVGQLRDAGTSANRAVAGFHLHHCRIYQSRFS